MSCGCRVRVAGDVDALVHVPQSIPDAATDLTATNWLSGVPAVSGSVVGFSNNQGDPTAVIAGSDYSAIVGGEANVITAGLLGATQGHSILGGVDNLIDSNWDDSAVIGGQSNRIRFGDQPTFPGYEGRSVILGGRFNEAQTPNTVIAGGSFHVTLTGGAIGGAHSSFIGGGFGCTIGVGAERSAIVGCQTSSIVGSNDSFLGGCDRSDISGAGVGGAGMVGANGSLVTADTGFIGGGRGQTVSVGGSSGVVAGTGSVVTGARSVIVGGSGSFASDADSFVCGSGSAVAGTPRTFAHGLGPADAVGFRGAPPVPAPVLAPIPAPTGIPGLDAWIASVDAALKTQGFAV